jgi:hypothetical protein
MNSSPVVASTVWALQNRSVGVTLGSVMCPLSRRAARLSHRS